MTGSTDLGSASDEALVRLLGSRDAQAFDELYARYSRRLLHYFHRMLGGNEEKAQDFLQDVFVTLFEKHRTFDPGRSFARWVFAVAHNMCCNEYRRLEVRRNAAQGVAADDIAIAVHGSSRQPDVEAAVDGGRFGDQLRSELRLLDDDRRSAFLLRYQEGFSVAAIGAILGCPVGTVKSRLFYTVRLLGDRLRRFDPGYRETAEDAEEDSQVC